MYRTNHIAVRSRPARRGSPAPLAPDRRPLPAHGVAHSCAAMVMPLVTAAPKARGAGASGRADSSRPPAPRSAPVRAARPRPRAVAVSVSPRAANLSYNHGQEATAPFSTAGRPQRSWSRLDTAQRCRALLLGGRSSLARLEGVRCLYAGQSDTGVEGRRLRPIWLRPQGSAGGRSCGDLDTVCAGRRLVGRSQGLQQHMRYWQFAFALTSPGQEICTRSQTPSSILSTRRLEQPSKVPQPWMSNVDAALDNAMCAIRGLSHWWTEHHRE